QGGRDYGDSVIKLSSSNLSRLDYFSPFNQATLDENDLDLGAGGITLLPDQATAPKHLMVTVGKQGVIYLINRDSLGGNNASVDKVVQEKSTTSTFRSTPIFWNNTLYFGEVADYPKAFSFSKGRISSNPTSQAAVSYRYPGAIMTVSANSLTNGILWAM